MSLSLYEGSDLPPVIQRAIARVMDPSLPLTPAERVALATLVARVEARDGTAEFWVRRLNFAELVGRVERTVSLWLASLEEKGWVTKEQGRTRWGNFRSLTLQLTDAGARYLGLLRDSDLSTAYRKKNAGGYRRSNQDLKHSSRRHLASEDASQPLGSESRVPDDCRALLDVGLSPAAIFKLMAIATRHGKRLAGIVEARMLAIRDARKPYAYISKLARDSIDYSAVAALARADRARIAKKDAEREAADRFTEAYRDRFVEDSRGNRILFQRDCPPAFYERRKDGWSFVGCIVGDRLSKLWDWMREAVPRPLPAARLQDASLSLMVT